MFQDPNQMHLRWNSLTISEIKLVWGAVLCIRDCLIDPPEICSCKTVRPGNSFRQLVYSVTVN